MSSIHQAISIGLAEELVHKTGRQWNQGGGTDNRLAVVHMPVPIDDAILVVFETDYITLVGSSILRPCKDYRFYYNDPELIDTIVAFVIKYLKEVP